MAKTSTIFLCSFSFSPFPSLSRWRETNSFLPSPFRFSNRPSPFLRFSSKPSDSGNFLGDDSFGFFPWSPDDNDLEWVQEERVTLFTSDGLIQIGGSMVPRRLSSSDKKQGKLKSSQRFQRFQESDYMDPKQGLCLGALFDIAATNGLDMGRRLCIIGFCRSIEMLSDVVEDTVLEHGGEVVAAEKAIKGGLHEKLSMTVAVPYLWGVPPASDTLHLAVRSGGGIVEKVYWQWDFL
ncbi:D-tagatose-1,6-bisphosphate aldolase subunit [Gossypium australe]|uniref:D-tagatose-1,6-bisphosphate aldolase subunit n=1 Tax=Gossypium australe TaxID=47621 RepID=A0A5B6VBC6_9ROSI|nr:D-tagatose-1,6-bisphosphate aldolase subunit [Gossypium australe]